MADYDRIAINQQMKCAECREPQKATQWSYEFDAEGRVTKLLCSSCASTKRSEGRP